MTQPYVENAKAVGDIVSFKIFRKWVTKKNLNYRTWLWSLCCGIYDLACNQVLCTAQAYVESQ